MGEHATKSNSLSGKSLLHVNELSLSLGANKFCPISLQPHFNSFILWELDVQGDLQFSRFLSARLFPMKNYGCLLSLSHTWCDGCALSFKSNPTWLSFSSDDIRVYLKGWGLGVCMSDFLAKPPDPGDGERRITVSASLGGKVTVCLWDLNRV